MRERKYVGKNQRVNIADMVAAKNPIINLAGEQYKREKENEMMMNKIVDQNLERIKAKKNKDVIM